MHHAALEEWRFEALAQPFGDQRRIAPLRRRRRARRWRRRMAADEGEDAPHQMLRRPGRENHAAAGLEHASHLCDRNLGPRREQVTELAEHDVEGCIRIGQRLGIALTPGDRIQPRNLCVFACLCQQFRRQVQCRDAGAEARRRQCHDTGAGADIEHALAWTHRSERNHMPGHWRRERRSRPERGSHGTLAGLQFGKGIGAHGEAVRLGECRRLYAHRVAWSSSGAELARKEEGARTSGPFDFAQRGLRNRPGSRW
jgi:hypothetical protein